MIKKMFDVSQAKVVLWYIYDLDSKSCILSDMSREGEHETLIVKIHLEMCPFNM